MMLSLLETILVMHLMEKDNKSSEEAGKDKRKDVIKDATQKQMTYT